MTEKQVIEYLLNHPDFVSQHPMLLSELNLIPDQEGVTSLVRRQHALLREKNLALTHQIQDMITAAKENERIFQVFSACHRLLLNQCSFNELNTDLAQLVCNQLNLADCQLVRFNDQHRPLLDHKLAQCGHFLGRLSEFEQTLLCEKPHQSFAIYLIGSLQQPLALLIFASDDPLHYQPTQSSLFVMEFVKALETKLSHLL